MLFRLLVLLVLGTMLLLFARRWMLDALIEAIERFRDGGPGSPMHPLPSNDAAQIRKRTKAGAE